MIKINYDSFSSLSTDLFCDWAKQVLPAQIHRQLDQLQVLAQDAVNLRETIKAFEQNPKDEEFISVLKPWSKLKKAMPATLKSLTGSIESCYSICCGCHCFGVGGVKETTHQCVYNVNIFVLYKYLNI